MASSWIAAAQQLQQAAGYAKKSGGESMDNRLKSVLSMLEPRDVDEVELSPEDHADATRRCAGVQAAAAVAATAYGWRRLPGPLCCVWPACRLRSHASRLCSWIHDSPGAAIRHASHRGGSVALACLAADARPHAPTPPSPLVYRAKEYSRLKMAAHRAWQADLSTKLNLKRAAIAALPEHLRAAAGALAAWGAGGASRAAGAKRASQSNMAPYLPSLTAGSLPCLVNHWLAAEKPDYEPFPLTRQMWNETPPIEGFGEGAASTQAAGARRLGTKHRK